MLEKIDMSEIEKYSKDYLPQATERSIESSGLSRFKSTAKNTAAIPIIRLNILLYAMKGLDDGDFDYF